MTTLPDDWFCDWGPIEQGGVPGFQIFSDVHTQCPTYLGNFVTNAAGIISCPACGKEVGIETDLEADMIVEDGVGNDDDNDGNMDNPEFNNAAAILEGELIDETAEEQMRREVIAVIMGLAEELFERAKPPREVEDEQEKEHYELLGNKMTYYGAMLASNAEDIASLFMHFSKYGINAFGGERVAKRRAVVLAVFLVYRMERGFVFDEVEIVKLLAENMKRVDNIRSELIRAKLGEDQNETGYYVSLYARALGVEEEIATDIETEWNRDIEPFIRLHPQIVALAFVLSALENLHGQKISTAKATRLSDLPRLSVSKVRKKFDDHFRTIKSTS